MLKMLALVTVYAASSSATTGRTIDGWLLVREEGGCHISSPVDSGTTLSVVGDGSDELLFLFENPTWHSLHDKALYKFDVEFDDRGKWPIEAIGWAATTDFPPRFSFLRKLENDPRGEGFIAQFGASDQIHVTKGEQHIASVRLSGSTKAFINLMWCLREFRDPFKNLPPEPDRS